LRHRDPHVGAGAVGAPCYHRIVPVRVVAIIGTAVALFGVLVYLHVAVHAESPVQGGPPAAAAPIEAPAAQASDRDSRAESARSGQPVLGRTAPVTPSPRRTEPMPVPTDLATDPDLEVATAMDEVNRLYDRSDYDGAQQGALRILERMPGNIRMLRVVVSSACMMGEPDKAQKYWIELPEHDRAQMTTRCSRFGVTFQP
jgi:hypothetical protein